MSSVFRFFAGLACLSFLAGTANSADPSWWSQGSPPVVSGTPDPLAVANIGQAKWMAYRAVAALTAVDATVGGQVNGDLVGTGKPLTSWAAPDPNVQAQLDAQKAPLTVGQLKALAAPFYARLNAVAAVWLAHERSVNLTETGDGIYPWTVNNTADDSNMALATIGQVKAVFALHFAEDANNNGTSDLYEAIHGAGVPGATAGDADGDGILDPNETASTVGVKDNPAVNLAVTVVGGN